MKTTRGNGQDRREAWRAIRDYLLEQHARSAPDPSDEAEMPSWLRRRIDHALSTPVRGKTLDEILRGE